MAAESLGCSGLLSTQGERHLSYLGVGLPWGSYIVPGVGGFSDLPGGGELLIFD